MPRFPPHASAKGAQAAAQSHRGARREWDAALEPLLLQLHGQGLSQHAIAAELGRRGIRTRQGLSRWHARQVGRILGRLLGGTESNVPEALPAPEPPCHHLPGSVTSEEKAIPPATAQACDLEAPVWIDGQLV